LNGHVLRFEAIESLEKSSPQRWRERKCIARERPIYAARGVRRQERVDKLIEAGTTRMARDFGRCVHINADSPFLYEHPISDSLRINTR
jgi:hypothetical protein